MAFPLCELSEGSCAAVAGLAGLPDAQRLMDLGFIPGVKVKTLFSSPLGDPVAYGVLGGVIALRSRVARKILVEPCSEGGFYEKL